MNNKFKNAIALGGFIIAAIIVAFFIWKEEDVELLHDTANEDLVEEVVKEEEDNIFVYIIGAVHEPGVVKIKNGARLYEVLELVGGTSDDANLGLVNLASIVRDEQKIVIPYIASGDDLNLTKNYIEINVNDNKFVNINTASQSELQKLTGIGESTARKIVEYREQNGSFKNLEELMNVNGIGKSKFNAIKADITL